MNIYLISCLVKLWQRPIEVAVLRGKYCVASTRARSSTTAVNSKKNVKTAGSKVEKPVLQICDFCDFQSFNFRVLIDIEGTL